MIEKMAGLPLSFLIASSTGQVNCADKQSCDTGLPNVPATGAQLDSILKIFLALVGAIMVIVIIIAGIRFITSQGNPQEVAKARNTILYAVIGLIVIIAAETIVTFVLSSAG